MQEPEFEPDYWTLTNDVIIRHHKTPRTKKFMPDEVECPIPLKDIDILRKTRTDLDTLAEKEQDDFWTEHGPTEMSFPWKGSTMFDLLRPKPPHGFTWCEARLTKVQKTTGPGNIRPEN